MNSLRDRRGQSLVALALMMPIMAGSFFALTEANNLIISQMRMSSLSREAASAAYRDCAPFTDPARLEQCLTEILEKVEDAANRMVDEFDEGGAVIMSIYEDDGEGNAVLKQAWPAQESNGYVSHFTTESFEEDFVTTQKTIAIGEVFYRHRLLVPIQVLAHFVGDLAYDIPGALYEATVY